MPHTYWYFWRVYFGCRNSIFVMTFGMVVISFIFIFFGGGRQIVTSWQIFFQNKPKIWKNVGFSLLSGWFFWHFFKLKRDFTKFNQKNFGDFLLWLDNIISWNFNLHRDFFICTPRAPTITKIFKYIYIYILHSNSLPFIVIYFLRSLPMMLFNKSRKKYPFYC